MTTEPSGAAADQLAAFTRDHMPTMITAARTVMGKTRDREHALAFITSALAKESSAVLAAITADALIRLVEGEAQ